MLNITLIIFVQHIFVIRKTICTMWSYHFAACCTNSRRCHPWRDRRAWGQPRKMSGLPCSISEHGHHAGAFTTSSGKIYSDLYIYEIISTIERLQHILVTPFNIVLQDQKNIIPNVLPLPPSTASTSVPNSVQPSTVTTNTNIQQQPTTSGRIVCQPCVGQPTPPHVQQVRLPVFSYRIYIFNVF